MYYNIFHEPSQNKTPGGFVHLINRHTLVFKLFHDCTQKQQDPLRTNVFRLQAIMAYYHFVGEAGLICSICAVNV